MTHSIKKLIRSQRNRRPRKNKRIQKEKEEAKNGHKKQMSSMIRYSVILSTASKRRSQASMYSFMLIIELYHEGFSPLA